MQVATTTVTPIKKQNGGVRPGAGRPKKNPNSPQDKQLHLPPLPKGFRSTPLELIKWWIALTPEQSSHLSVYVYRKWPTWDAKRFDPKAVTNIKLYTGPCPFTEESWEREMLTEFGSGDYSFSINDDSINRWSVAVKGLRDFDNYPPLVDTRLLMLDDPANKTYVDFLRQRGRLEGIDIKGTEDSMAANAALERTIDMAERMTDRVLDLSAAATQRPQEPDMQHRAELRGMELVQEAGKESINFMRETMSEVTRMQNQNANPLEVVDKLVSVASAITGGNNRGTDQSTTILIEHLREEGKAMREELADNRKLIFELLTKKSNPEEDTERPKGLLGRLQERLENKVLDSLDKDGSTSEQDEDGKKKGSSMTAGLLEMAIKNAPAIMTGLDSIIGKGLNAFLLARSQQPGSNITLMPNPGNGVATPPIQQTAPPQLPLTPPPPPDPRQRFVANISSALLWHLHGGIDYDGHTFAGWLISSGPDGRKNYEIMRETEKAQPGQIIAALETHPPLWNEIKDTPEKLNKFLAEFLEFDEWKEREEMDEGEDEPTEL